MAADGAPERGARETAAGPQELEAREARLAWACVAPALAVIVAVALFPLAWTFWESLHLHDLRLPDLGRPFVGLRNYVELAQTPRFYAAFGHTLFFTAASVTLELVLGLALALALNRAYRGRGAVRTAALLPWAVPTVVAGLVWRFVFEGPTGGANVLLSSLGAIPEPLAWFSRPGLAWTPVILADVWKTTPFAALLLLAGLQTIDPALYEAARIDGAGPIRRLFFVTLPLLRPAILVALVFRTLDAFRIFDLLYVLTGGGPGTSTEVLALYTFDTLLQSLRFGLGSALSVVIFVATFSLALAYIRVVGTDAAEGAR